MKNVDKSINFIASEYSMEEDLLRFKGEKGVPKENAVQWVVKSFDILHNLLEGEESGSDRFFMVLDCYLVGINKILEKYSKMEEDFDVDFHDWWSAHTGISDILSDIIRGETKASETATAQDIKARNEKNHE